MSSGMIRCRGVVAGAGEEVVLRGVELEIAPGSFLPVVGENGAGKTTLLRVLLGLIPLRGGVLETPFAKRAAGYVPQAQKIDPVYPVSLFEIVALGLYPSLGWWGRVKGAHRLQVEGMLERFGLLEHAQKRFVECSGGMKQKTLLARALLGGPEVLVLDEPFTGLDAGAREEVLSILLELWQKEQKTIIVTLHGLDLFAVPVEEVCLIEGGRAALMAREEILRGWGRGAEGVSLSAFAKAGVE